MKTPERWRWFLGKMKMETVSGKDEDGIDIEYTFKPTKQRIKEDGIYLAVVADATILFDSFTHI
jgi:hypothetical protein